MWEKGNSGDKGCYGKTDVNGMMNSTGQVFVAELGKKGRLKGALLISAGKPKLSLAMTRFIGFTRMLAIAGC